MHVSRDRAVWSRWRKNVRSKRQQAAHTTLLAAGAVRGDEYTNVVNDGCISTQLS